MRTTVDIDEYVLARAKDDARAAGVTLGKYIERALGREQNALRPSGELPLLPVIDGGELLIPIHEMTNAEIQDYLDEGVPLDKLR